METTLTNSQLKTLASRLVELREKQGVSAMDVARDALGYENGSHVAVSRLERAIIARPRQEHLRKLAAFYGVKPEYLLATETASRPAPFVPVALSRPPAKRMAAPVSQPTAHPSSARASAKVTRAGVNGTASHPSAPKRATSASRPTSSSKDSKSTEDLVRYWMNWRPL